MIWLYNYKSTSNLDLVIQPFDLHQPFDLLESAVACQDSAAGIPALVIPHLVDQFHWGQRVYEMGAGPQPIRRAKLDPQILAESMVEII